MKKEKKKKEKSTLELLREIRDQISLETQDMTFEELKKYIEKQPTLFPNAIWK